MLFDQPTDEAGPRILDERPHPGAVAPVAGADHGDRTLPYRRGIEPSDRRLDRYDWLEPLEPLIRNTQSWIVTACFVFALSPVVLWTAWSFLPSIAPQWFAPTPPAAEAPTPGATTPTTPPTQEPIGPTARFGTESTPDPGGDLDLSAGPPPSGGVDPSSVVADDHAGPCHPSYSGCLPIVDDIDCTPNPVEVDAAASTDVDADADGPLYLDGPVLVTGDDAYRLDTNGDQVGCFDGDR